MGWKTGDMLEGIEPILNLAIASNADLGTTSDIVTDALTAFGLSAKDAGQFSDVLAAASSNANTNVVMMGETFKYAAPVAGALGYSVQDTALAIGLMANSGIKASQAGTALRAGLTNLVNPTDTMAAAMKKYGISVKDSNGQMKPFRQTMAELREKLGHLDKATQAATVAQIFGKEAMSGWLAIINASQGDFDKLASSIDNSEGATAKMAKTMSENAKGSIAEMKSALEESAIKVFETLAPAITDVANSVSDLANKFSSLSPETQEFIVKAGMAAVAVGPVVSGVGKLSKGIGGLIKAGSGIASFFGLVSSGSATATTAVGGATIAAEGATAATAGASAAVGGLGSVLASSAVPIALGAAAIAGVGYAGYKTYKYLSSSATPAVDLFADKVQHSTEKITLASGAVVNSAKQTTIKISESTKKAVGAYMELDKKASNSLMNLRVNSDKFTKEAKDKVLKNFTDMSNKSSNLSEQQRKSMTISFKKLVSDTGVLTSKNKEEIIKHYAEMVQGTTELSKEQKEQVIKEFSETLQQSTSITSQQSQDLQKIYTDMGNKIKEGLDKKKEEETKSLQDFFATSNAITTEEQAKILQKTNEHWDNKKKSIDDYEKQINDIVNKASEEHRQITNAEAKSIDEIQKKMKEDAIKTLSENEVESKVILERIKGNDEHITAEQASEHIKKLNELRDKAIDAANEECDKRIANFIRMRDEEHTLTEEQANKCIEEAKRQRDETIDAAEETRNKAVDKITDMNSNISKNVNTTTGDVLTHWQRLANWWANWHPVDKILNIFTKKHGKEAESNWTGNSYFKGGYTTLHERGYELYDLPSGTRIYNHDASEELVKETAKNLAEQLSYANNNGNTEIIQNIYAPVPTPSEIARQTRNMFRELALS